MDDDNLNNPLFKDLTINHGQLNGELLQREIQYGDKFYEQYVHYLTHENLIRSYIFDITTRKNTEAKLQYQAYHDSVTNIANRDFFYAELKKIIAQREFIIVVAAGVIQRIGQQV